MDPFLRGRLLPHRGLGVVMVPLPPCTTLSMMCGPNFRPYKANTAYPLKRSQGVTSAEPRAMERLRGSFVFSAEAVDVGYGVVDPDLVEDLDGHHVPRQHEARP